MFGDDREDIAFNIYRRVEGGDQERLNAAPLDKVTWFVDEHAPLDKPTSYFVRSVAAAEGSPPSREFTLPAHAHTAPCLEFPITPPFGYRPNDATAGDLDGDGEYEIVLHRPARAATTPERPDDRPRGSTPTSSTARCLWRINLGRNIREGAHYTQFMVYDLDGDGRAEVACKTADGTIDGAGKAIGDADADYVNSNGHILDGPEYPDRLRRPHRRGARHDRLHPAARRHRRCGATTTAIASIASSPASPTSTASGPASSCAAATTRAPCSPPGTGATASSTHVWTFDTDDGTPGNDELPRPGQPQPQRRRCRRRRPRRNHLRRGRHRRQRQGPLLHRPAATATRCTSPTSTPTVRASRSSKPTATGRSHAGIQMRDARTGEQLWGVPCPGRDDVGRGVRDRHRPAPPRLRMLGRRRRRRRALRRPRQPHRRPRSSRLQHGGLVGRRPLRASCSTAST